MSSIRGKIRRDSKHRILRAGESVRKDGKYQFKYHVNGKPKFIYSWRLEPTDKLPAGKKPCKSLREMEREIGRDMESLLDPTLKNMTVIELVERYLRTKTGVKESTRMGYKTVTNFLEKEPFGHQRICEIRTSDAKLYLIHLQESGKSYSAIHTIRGVLRPAFQLAVDDDILLKNPFNFEMQGLLINDSKGREAVSKSDMRKFLDFVYEDNAYCKYYEAFYILFHTGLRISEFCGLTVKDIDFVNNTINVDRQLQRLGMKYVIVTTKTNAGTRVLPMTSDVAECFRAIIDERQISMKEPAIDGVRGFLFLDENQMPLVAMHWQHRMKNAWNRYNDIYRVQLPPITPHVCRHTYCSNMAKNGMSPKTLQYLMGHSDISVTMNVYTHLGLEDAASEVRRLEELEKARVDLERTGVDPEEKARTIRVVS